MVKKYDNACSCLKYVNFTILIFIRINNFQCYGIRKSKSFVGRG